MPLPVFCRVDPAFENLYTLAWLEANLWETMSFPAPLEGFGPFWTTKDLLRIVSAADPHVQGFSKAHMPLGGNGGGIPQCHFG